MSHPKLHAFLTKLDDELGKYKEYRSELNREPHTFVFHKVSLLNETLKQLRKGHNMDLDKKDESAIKVIVDNAAQDLVKQLRVINGGTLKSPGGRTTLVFDKDTNVPIPKYRDISLPYTAFTRVKFAYRSSMNAMFTELQTYLRNHKTLNTIKTKNGSEKKSIMYFFDAGHDKNAGVFERFLDEKTAGIMNALNSSIEKDSDKARNKLLSELKSATGIDLKIKKVDDLSTIIISIESTSVNRSRGAQTGIKSRKIRKKLKDFIDSSAMDELEGSDSLKQQKIKKTKNEILDPFRKVKNVTVSKSHKIKKSKQSTISKKEKIKAKRKVASIAVVAKARKTKARRKAKASPASSMLQMIAMINKELPDTVRKNMQPPALENRSGRFAESVRVTEVAQTPRGFPSVGYTYQRRPYEVFEMGSPGPWSSPERDPRKLIDKSIREIAARMAIGRFYTRRV